MLEILLTVIVGLSQLALAWMGWRVSRGRAVIDWTFLAIGAVGLIATVCLAVYAKRAQDQIVALQRSTLERCYAAEHLLDYPPAPPPKVEPGQPRTLPAF